MVKDEIEIELSKEYDDSVRCPVNRLGKFRQCLATFIANIITICLGTVNGWAAPVQPQLQSETPPVGRRLSDDEISWLGAITFMGGVAGVLVWARAADLLGRKGAGYLIAAPFLLSWTLLLFCDHYYLLLAARFIAGFGGTGVLVNTPLYVGEIACAQLRGPLGSSLILFINFGYLLAYFFGSVLTYARFNFFCLLLPVVYLALFAYLPETPNYLYMNRREDEAKRSLLYFCGDNARAMNHEFNLIASVTNGGPRVELSDFLRKKSTRRALVIGMVLITGQQVVGINILLTYTVAIFSAAGSAISPNLCSVIVGVAMLIASIPSCYLINRLGRKYLLIFTSTGMSASLLLLAVCFLFDKSNAFVQSTYLPLVSFSTAIVCYALGVGPVPFVLSSEIFPSSVRNMATSLIIAWGIFGSFATVKLYPSMLSLLGYFGTFSLFSVSALCLSLFIHFCVPETKNLSLNAVIELLENHSTLKVGRFS
ncbi:unnamed protein product [Bemisia tabaci]|uniref:Major facilitator superfamily (MFS) profile domain-containing protein n=1 Tax=Bemisia tabaci TaxID=7038 RepID=A0A9P0F223_BEMTA|nr:unnamed protein product [Bemisia tabaci]